MRALIAEAGLKLGWQKLSKTSSNLNPTRKSIGESAAERE